MTYRKLKTLGAIADAHWALELAKRKLEAKIRDIRDDMSRYALDAIELSKEQGNPVCRGKRANGKVGKSEFAGISNRAALDKWIIKTKHTAVLQARVSITEVRDLEKEGISVPGIKIVEVPKFSTSRLRSKK